MTSRRRQAADRNQQRREEEEERRVQEGSDRETPRKSRSKKLSRTTRTHQGSPASRSDREEEFHFDKKTPKRFTKGKSWTSTINSPSNDAEQQHEIFWDPNSPTSFRLENGKRKATARKCTVEISDIVNRIAPKNEKPTTSDAAYLGLWIGDDAIPCTPVMSRPRAKLNRSRILKTEEKLMELAKQLDRNLVEHKDQYVEPPETVHKTVNTGTVEEGDISSFLEGIPEEDEVCLMLKSVSQRSGAAAQSSQKSVDVEAEEALNALFDCSTQKVSGRLSQGLSDVSTNSFQGAPVQNVSKENQLFAKDPSENGSKEAISSEKEKVAVNMVLSVSTSQDDFEDDWGEDILEDDSFVMQVTQNPELIATPKSSLPPEKSKPSITPAFNGKLDCTTKASAPKEQYSFKFVPQKVTDSKGTKLESNFERTVSALVLKTEDSSQDKGGLYKIPVTGPQGPSGGQVIKQNTALKPSTNSSARCEVSKTYTFHSKSLNARGEKDQVVKKCVHTVVQKSATSNSESVLCDEWDDPRFSDEVLDMFCKSDGVWNEKDDDDDLLYQVCNDVERLTQVQTSKETTPFFSSSHYVSTKAFSDNKTGSHISTTFSCSSKFSGYANANKCIPKGSSPASVSGNCLSTFQNSSSQRTSQASKTFNRTYSLPSGADCIKMKIKEPNPDNSPNSTTTTTNSHAPSKYSFTKIKPSQILSVHTNKTLPGSDSSYKGNHFHGFSERKDINTQTNVLPSQQSSLKRHFSESTIHSSKVSVSEDRSKKCSTEEIERKKQEALARRKIKARACSSDNTPT